MFKPARTSPLRAALDTFASDGPLAAAVSETAEAGASHIPELFRSVMPSSPASAAVESAKKAEENVVAIVSETKGKWREGARNAVSRYVPGSVLEVAGHAREWWTRERVHRVAEASLPNRHLDALTIEGMCPRKKNRNVAGCVICGVSVCIARLRADMDAFPNLQCCAA